MNFLNKVCLSFLASVVVFSCSSDPELGPIITVDKAEIGAFPRLVTLIAGEYDLANTGTSAYAHEVEFQSEDAGVNVSTYEIQMSFIDNDPSNGDNSTALQVFKTFSQSDFGSSTLGLKNITVTVPLTEAAAFVGVDIANISPGDVFAYESNIVLSDGRVFGQDNTESTILSSAFRAYFNWTVTATCPLPDELFVGSYALSYDEYGDEGFAVSLTEENVTLELIPGSTTKRSFAGNFLSNFGPFDVTVIMDFVCDKAFFLDVNSGVGCGAPNIFMNGGDPQPQNITDDSVILLEYIEAGGGCGYDAQRLMRLTKV